MNLWNRTKSIAKLYTGTFITVMILNQLIFFGFCLNPICLIAAMPHVLFITVFIGSWLNNKSGWGSSFNAHANPEKCEVKTDTVVETPLPFEKVIPKKIENKIDSKILFDFKDKIKRKPIETLEQFDYDITNLDYYGTCHSCGAHTVLRTAKNGKFAGKDFYGCSKYPECTGIIRIKTKKIVIKKSTQEKQLKNIENGRPKNAGFPWTIVEKEQLFTEFNSGMSIEDISESHERTEGGIIAELKKQGLIDQ